MTRKEAINIISQMIKDEEGFLSDNTVEAHKIAIKALEKESTLDKIRAEITNISITDSDGHFNNWYREPQAIINDVLQIIDEYKAESEGKE